ncbi:hypothetical protein ATCC90586_007098 [Pythium insidiosum]|nr:hypothetical protein ATCC90586_007098 [Pythium insidiosum]
MADELRRRHAEWCKDLEHAVQADGWGQVLEAVEAYERLSEQLGASLVDYDELSREQKASAVIEKAARTLEKRAHVLSSVDGGDDRGAPTNADMEDLLDALKRLLGGEPVVVPLEKHGGSKAEAASQRAAALPDREHEDDDVESYMKAARKPRRGPGATYVDVEVAQIGLKDAKIYVNPTIVVSVFDKDGKSMEEAKETGIGRCEDPTTISFGNTVLALESSLASMEQRNAAVFLELYHFKPKKRKKSCRCWALLEMDELRKGGALALELYQKPMDPKRKRIHLFTVKELYLHVSVRTAST